MMGIPFNSQRTVEIGEKIAEFINKEAW